MKRRKQLLFLITMVCVVASISGCLKLGVTQPQALFTVSALENIIPFTTNFDATLSFVPEGEIVSYLWTFGDGSSDTGVVAEHTYKQDGDFEVTLTVFDAQGRSATTSLQVRALNPLPTAAFSYSPSSNYNGEQVVSASEIIKFDGADSTDNEEVVSYAWNFGDQTYAEGQKVEHKFLYPGTYNVVLTVTDNDGEQTNCIHKVTVLGGPPCNADVTGDAIGTWPVGGSCQ